MEHTVRTMRITIASMGVFMTASEANRQRVLALLLFEDEQMCELVGTTDRGIPAVQRGPPMFETRQPWISVLSNMTQSLDS
jgi:hypothetical protein